MKVIKYLFGIFIIVISLNNVSLANNETNETNETNKIKIISAFQTSVESGKKIKEKFEKDYSIKEWEIYSIKKLEDKINLINKEMESPHTEEEIEILIDNKNKLFKEFINRIENNKNIEFISKNNEEQISDIKSKINYNIEHKNTYNIQKYNLLLDNLILNEEFSKLSKDIYLFLNKYQKEKEIKEELNKLNQNVLLYENKYKTYNDYLNKNNITTLNSEILEYKILFNSYKDFVQYLTLNQNTIFEKNIIFIFEIDKIINYINNNSLFFNINKILYHFNLDLGRLLLFISSLMIFYVLKNRLKYFIDIISKPINNKNNIFKIIFKYIDNIKIELGYFIVIFGFEISFNLLIYPNNNQTIQNIMYIFKIITLTLIILKFFNFIIEKQIEKISEKKIQKSKKEAIHLGIKFGNISIVLYFIILILNHFNVNFIMGIISVISFIGLALSLGAKELVSNLFGGLKLLLDGSISQGDIIEFETIRGHVIERGLLSTQIRTFYNEMVIIPNADLVNKFVKNSSRKKVGNLIKLNIHLDFENDFSQIEDVKLEIEEYLKNNEDISIEYINLNKKRTNLLSSNDLYGIKKNMYVKISDITDFSLKLKVICYSKTVDYEEWMNVKDKVIMEVMKIINNNKIKIYRKKI
jgi:MscS family membrane protein